MNRYAKGANFEREIVTDLWSHGWASMRAAGSGTTSYPVPDVIGARNGRLVLIECKTTKSDRLSLKQNILALEEFRKLAGGEAYIAIKFYKKPARFYNIKPIIEKNKYTITINDTFLNIDSILFEQTTL
jgi:Holliday junction resolvase